MDAQYDKIAAAYTRDDRVNHPMRQTLYASWLNECGNIKGQRVLDLCCGNGHSSRLLARAGAEVVGIEKSAGMLKLAAAHEPLGIEYVQGDIGEEKLPINQDQWFDLVTGAFCYHYAESFDELVRFARNSARHLKSGGRVVAININPDHPTQRYIRGITSTTRWVGKPWTDGSRLRTTVYNSKGKRITSFTNRHWNKSTYQRAFTEAGFGIVDWTDPMTHTKGRDPNFNWGILKHFQLLWTLTATKA